MTTALYALKWNKPLNPTEQLDFTFEAAGYLLETGETVASYTLTFSAASIAAGLTIGSGAYATTQPTATSFKFWFSIDPAHIADTQFDGAGILCDMILDITTTNNPARKRRRTLLLQVCRL